MARIRKKNIILEDTHHKELANNLWERASKMISPKFHFLMNETLKRWGFLDEDAKRRFLRSLIKIVRTKTDSVQFLRKEALKHLDEIYLKIDPNSSVEEDKKKAHDLASRLNVILQIFTNTFFQNFQGWEFLTSSTDTDFAKVSLELQGYLLKISLKKMPSKREVKEATLHLFDSMVRVK